jgi:hypothetical protein
MKVKELKENIRAKVREALTVKLAGGTALTAPQKSAKIAQLRTTTGDQTVGTEKNPIDFVREAGEYTMDKIYKMTRTELIDFAGLTPQDAAKYSTRTLQGIALELADDKPSDEGSIDEEDFMDDDDNTIIEDVEDIDDKDPTFKNYDSIYEINANVGSGVYEIEVGKDGIFITLIDNTGNYIKVHPDDVKELVKVILKKYNEAD